MDTAAPRPSRCPHPDSPRGSESLGGDGAPSTWSTAADPPPSILIGPSGADSLGLSSQRRESIRARWAWYAAPERSNASARRRRASRSPLSSAAARAAIPEAIGFPAVTSLATLTTAPASGAPESTAASADGGDPLPEHPCVQIVAVRL